MTAPVPDPVDSVARVPGRVRTTLFSDAACPWAYSAAPALRVLEWRYGEQLEWRLVLIGLTERAEQYVERGYTPLRSALGYASRFRRYGMPFSPEPRARVIGTGRACRAVVAARILEPGSEWAVFRALQFAWFTSTLLLDEDAAIREAIADVPGIDPDAIVAILDRENVVEAYERDRAEARTAAGSADRVPGQVGRNRRPRPLHGPIDHLRAGRHAARGRWIPTGRGLRRRDRKPRPHAPPPTAAGDTRAAARTLPPRADDPGGRRLPHPGQRTRRTGRPPSQPCSNSSPTAKPAAPHSATTQSGPARSPSPER